MKLATEAIYWTRPQIIERLAQIADELISVRADLARCKADEARAKAKGYEQSISGTASNGMVKSPRQSSPHGGIPLHAQAAHTARVGV